MTVGSPSRKFGKLFVVALLDERRYWQRLQTCNHLGDGGRGRVNSQHISGPNDDEFNDLPEGDILGQPDGLGIAAPECTSLGDSHGLALHKVIIGEREGLFRLTVQRQNRPESVQPMLIKASTCLTGERVCLGIGLHLPASGFQFMPAFSQSDWVAGTSVAFSIGLHLPAFGFHFMPAFSQSDWVAGTSVAYAGAINGPARVQSNY